MSLKPLNLLNGLYVEFINVVITLQKKNTNIFHHAITECEHPLILSFTSFLFPDTNKHKKQKIKKINKYKR